MTTKTETIVTVRKAGQKIEQHNAALDAAVDPREFDTAAAAQSTMNAKLCMNMLAGKVSKQIKTAAAERGKLRELMPSASNADLNAIKACLEHSPATLRKGWQAHVDKSKRIHGVTLQAISKSVAAPKPKAKPFKDQYAEAWSALFTADRDLACSEELKRLYNLAIDAGWENPDEVSH